MSFITLKRCVAVLHVATRGSLLRQIIAPDGV